MMYTGFQQATQRLVNRFGKQVTYTSKGAATYNIDTGGVTTATDKNFTVVAAESMPRWRDTQQPNLVGKKIVVFYISTLDICNRFTPKVGDYLIHNAVTYYVQDVMLQNGNGGVPAGYRLVLTND